MATKFEGFHSVDPGAPASEVAPTRAQQDAERGRQVVGAAADRLGGLMISASEQVGQGILNVKEKGRGMLSSLSERISGGISGGWNKIKGITQAIASAPEKLASFAYQAVGAGERVGKAVIDKARGDLTGLWREAGAAKDRFLGSARDAYNAAAGTVKAGAERAQASLVERKVTNEFAPDLHNVLNEIRLLRSGARLQQQRAELDHALLTANTADERASAGQAIADFENSWPADMTKKVGQLEAEYLRLVARRESLKARLTGKSRDGVPSFSAASSPQAPKDIPVFSSKTATATPERTYANAA